MYSTLKLIEVIFTISIITEIGLLIGLIIDTIEYYYES